MSGEKSFPQYYVGRAEWELYYDITERIKKGECEGSFVALVLLLMLFFEVRTNIWC